jgi:hypothetical protein
MFNFIDRKYAGSVIICAVMAMVCFAGETSPKKHSRKDQTPVQIRVVPVGPTQEMLDNARLEAERSAAVQQELAGTRYRFIDLTYIDNEDKTQGAAQMPTRYRAVFYDYTNDRTMVAEGSFNGKEPVTVHQENFQPIPSGEEFDEAVRILQKDGALGNFLKAQTLKTYHPMPDTTVLSGTTERLVNIGLASSSAGTPPEVVSVSLKRGVVIRYPERAPGTSLATPEACGIPNAGQATTARNTAGQYQMTVTQGPTTLWEMLIIRPAVSSGTRASGIEVRDVKYMGKSVLKRGHVPVLNVKYGANECGPYRDWQYQEGQFETPATGNTDPAPGIRIVATGQVARTSLENGTDTGNFRGVAVYTLGTETVLTTELEAGWYRYIMEWRFDNNGTIRPRFGYGATDNSCVCFVHTHHNYWRFDFDIVQPNNNVYQVERGRRFLRPLDTEAIIPRNYQTNRSLLIQNAAGNEAYLLTPNLSDGVVNSASDPFPSGDFWVFQYKNVVGGTALQNELDDGFNSTTSSQAFIKIDPFANGESVANQDVVVWYGASFIHADGANLLHPSRGGEVITGSHVVGPDILPVRW